MEAKSNYKTKSKEKDTKLKPQPKANSKDKLHRTWNPPKKRKRKEPEHNWLNLGPGAKTKKKGNSTKIS